MKSSPKKPFVARTPARTRSTHKLANGRKKSGATSLLRTPGSPSAHRGFPATSAATAMVSECGIAGTTKPTCGTIIQPLAACTWPTSATLQWRGPTSASLVLRERPESRRNGCEEKSQETHDEKGQGSESSPSRKNDGQKIQRQEKEPIRSRRRVTWQALRKTSRTTDIASIL